MPEDRRSFLLTVIKKSIVESWAHGFGYDQYLWVEKEFYKNEPVSEQNYNRALRVLDKSMFADFSKTEKEDSIKGSQCP